jgi:hypothetical protein
MKRLPRLLPAVVAAAGLVGLSGCSAMKSAGAKVGETSRAAIAKVSKMFPTRVPVVEVREKQLKELPLGHERALAYQRTRERSFWFYTGPVDFKEPDLPPETAGDLEAGLLPPKQP